METMTFENVALYRVGMFGVSRIDCKTLKLETGQKYAQYSNATRVTYLEKGKRKPMAFMLAEREPWLRVVEGKTAPTPADGMVSQGDGSSISRYTSYDIRYITDFEDKLTESGIKVLFEIGAGHRGECGCGLCAGRMREMANAR